MATTAKQLQQLILLELGMNDERGPVNSSNIGIIWSLYDDKARVAPRLQYLYTLVKAVDIWLGQISTGDYIQVGIQIDDHDDRTTKWHQIRANAQAEIEKIEARARASRAPAVGSIAKVAPTATDDRPETTGMTDPNDRRLRGDPLLPPYTSRGF